MTVIRKHSSNTMFMQDFGEKLIAMREHKVFSQVSSLEDLRKFMESHVFAVWDFMSLVKRLQRDFTCINVPWIPPKNRMAARLINDIVLGEESDEMPGSHTGSHFHMYLAAMKEVGASTDGIEKFIELIEEGIDYKEALEKISASQIVKNFVKSTMEVCVNGTTEEVLGSFFYGREDSIPQMFSHFLNTWKVKPDEAPIFKYYLERHIELDGDDHGPAAKKIISSVIDGDEKKEERLYESASKAVNERILFWDGLLNNIESKREVLA